MNTTESDSLVSTESPAKRLFDAGRLPEHWRTGDRVRVMLLEADEGWAEGEILRIRDGKAQCVFDRGAYTYYAWIRLERLRGAA